MMSIATGCPKLTTTFCNIYQGGCATWKYQVWALHGWNFAFKNQNQHIVFILQCGSVHGNRGLWDYERMCDAKSSLWKNTGSGFVGFDTFYIVSYCPWPVHACGHCSSGSNKTNSNRTTRYNHMWNSALKSITEKKNLKNMSPSASIKGNLDNKIWLTNGSIVEHRITLNITTPQQYTTSTSHYFTNALPPKHIASTMHHLNVT